MKTFLKKIHAQAKRRPATIIFPEYEDKRIIEAVKRINRRKIAHAILLSKKEVPGKVNINNPDLQKKYSEAMFKIRKKKGWSLSKCKKLVQDSTYFGTMMVACNDADALISGASHTTAHTLLPALQLIKTDDPFHKVSSVFLMVMDKKLYLFADCAVNVKPTSHELAQIALDSALTAKKFGINPRVALLSFSTHGSAKHEEVRRIQKAVKIAKRKNKHLLIDGDIQVDAALVPKIAKLKAPKSALKGNANVLIFPDLNSGNICYKMVERLAGAQAIGPITQGLSKPVNDLSRGCSVEDIVHLAAITSVMSNKRK